MGLCGADAFRTESATYQGEQEHEVPKLKLPLSAAVAYTN